MKNTYTATLSCRQPKMDGHNASSYQNGLFDDWAKTGGLVVTYLANKMEKEASTSLNTEREGDGEILV